MKVAVVGDTTGGSWLARVEHDHAVPLAPTPDGPGRDVLREALWQELDLSTAAAVADEIPIADCTWLPPVTAPEKIIAVGLNYADHAREAELDLPETPIGFIKTSNSLVGHDQPVRFATGTTAQLDYEAELAVVIGRTVRDVPVEEALSAVLGYTVCNDISARDAQFADKQWFRGKSFDTFCPTGPWIVTADELRDPQRLAVTCRVNGTVLQDGSTADMVFDVADLISYFSRFMTLQAGDVISTGTPPGVGFARKPPVFLHHGDVVEAEVEHVGLLRNTIVEEPVGTRVGRVEAGAMS